MAATAVVDVGIAFNINNAARQDVALLLNLNNLCTGWQPLHRIQFAHSMGDMIVPYGNYLAFCEAHPDGENDWYRIDNTFSDQDHLSAGTAFVMKLGTEFFDYFQWIDAAAPTDIKTVYGLPFTVYGLPFTVDSWYDLQGRKVQSTAKKGVYILNGKKVVIK